MKTKILQFIQKYSLYLEFLMVFIITVPAFLSLMNDGYFSMHDDQHIARLYLFNNALKQGQLYPRWVDILGFGYGYPLFNFYPPLIYYVGEVFRLLRFSFIWSIKLVVISGFILGAWGMYLYMKRITDKVTAFLGSALFTYFSYHALTSYVRGALAEFFSISVLPFLFLTMHNLAKHMTLKNSIYMGIVFALLILTHPLIAFPTVFYILFFFLFYQITQKNNNDRIKLFHYFSLSGLISLALSAFFWVPSILEKKYTLVDSILLTELASYKIHFVYPYQFLFSPWAYGGSIAGPVDGMSFQLGRIHMGLAALAGILFLVVSIALYKKKRHIFNYFIFFSLILAWSIFMMIPASEGIWDAVQFLGYLQFPWRFLTFVTFFISAIGAMTVYFIKYIPLPTLPKVFPSMFWLRVSMTCVIIILTIITYQKYFKPQRIITTNDAERTSYEEIAWRISRTSFEFMPKGIKTTKSELNTTIPDISLATISRKEYEITKGKGSVQNVRDSYHKQIFKVTADTPLTFMLHTTNFPGWKACIKVVGGCEALEITDNNDFKLITVNLPKGEHEVRFSFSATPIRWIADTISFSVALLIGLYLFVYPRIQASLRNHPSHKHNK